MSVIPIAVRFRSIAAHALHLLIALTFGWCAIAPARAADVTERQIVIDIRAQPLASALIEFSKQTQVQVMSQGVDLAQRQTSGIAGKYTIAAALKQLLAGSHLEYSATGPNTIAVTAAATHTTALQPGDDQSGDRSYLRIAQAGPFAAAPQTSGSPDTQASDVQRSAQSETQEVKVVTQRPFTDENVDIRAQDRRSAAVLHLRQPGDCAIRCRRRRGFPQAAPHDEHRGADQRAGADIPGQCQRDQPARRRCQPDTHSRERTAAGGRGLQWQQTISPTSTAFRRP